MGSNGHPGRESPLAPRPGPYLQPQRRAFLSPGLRFAGRKSGSILVHSADTRPKLLILNHQLIWGDHTIEDLLAGLTSRYDGPVVYGHDLDVFS